MTLLEQCQVWHIHDQHQKIFDAIEALPPEQRTADTDMELARACNNLADPQTLDGRALLRRAIGLMEAHQEELQNTYVWNFRMGYAYYYLDQEGLALRYYGLPGAAGIALVPAQLPGAHCRSLGCFWAAAV